ncbi:MAG TPA: TrkA family potassium uptake protein [Cyclobacteriaceae bacterium]|nr:TrkA family potassium uptake protein [Cyclobacteriaceae bacterium]
MKFIIFGLGNYGNAIATKLTELGHEVIGVDNSMQKVDSLKDKISQVICMDSTDRESVSTLPLKDTDIAFVCIGEDDRASIMTSALLKQLKAKRIIGRAVSVLQETVLEAMGVKEIVHPEKDSAERMAKNFDIEGVIDSLNIAGDHDIVEVKVPDLFVGKNIQELNLREKYNVLIVTIIKIKKTTNLLGKLNETKQAMGVLDPNTVLQQNDILVLYGNIKDIKKLIRDA